MDVEAAETLDEAPQQRQDQDINTNIEASLSEVSHNLMLTAVQFSEISYRILSCLTLNNVGQLNAQMRDKLMLFHQKVLQLIKSKEKQPDYTQCVAYTNVVKLLASEVLPAYLIRPFMLFFEKQVFINLLNEILEVNFERTPGMIIKAKYMLEEFEESLVEEILLQLSGTEIYQLKQVVNRLADFFSQSLATKDQARRLLKLLEDKVKPVIGYDLMALS
uniref:hypothetical protein n=1 Tax=Facilibium subflavum TaxID=2219058 RepID=UPI0013C2C9AB